MLAILKKAAFAAILLCVAGVCKHPGAVVLHRLVSGGIYPAGRRRRNRGPDLYLTPAHAADRTGRGGLLPAPKHAGHGLREDSARMDQQDMIFLSDEPTRAAQQMQELNAAMN